MTSLLGSLCVQDLFPIVAAGAAAGLWSRSFIDTHPFGVVSRAGASRGYRVGRPLFIAAATTASALMAAELFII